MALSLRHQAKLAPKYILELDGLGLFVAQDQDLIGCNLTSDINKAIHYSVGFDDENRKANIWECELQRMVNSNNLKLNPVYL